MIAALSFSASSFAAPITVPNSDFSVVGNDGHVGGGGLLGNSGSSVIGNGPWNGTYKGILNTIAPPLLTITPGHATISGIAGVNVLGFLDNSGYFSQNLSTAYAASQHYVLTTTVDAGVPLQVGVFSTGEAGVALTRGNTVLASSSDAGSDLSLSLLSGTLYKVVLAYDTGTTVSGNVGVRLFSKPQNLVTANLLTSITFTSVTLSASDINPVASSVAPSGGTPQSATVDMAFATPFSVTVLDAGGDPVEGVTVTFAAPSSGPSVVLTATTAITDASGHAQVGGTANGIAGNYTVTVTVEGVGTPATFDLTNTAGSASSVGSATGTPQSAIVNTAFSTPLGVTVTDADGNPLPNVTVTFSAPTSGASASFPGGATTTTNAEGIATIDAMANTVAGNYAITATVVGATTSATFAMTNIAGPAANASAFGGTPQTAQIDTPFNAPLSTAITDAYGNPVSGAQVTFSAPGTGASATFNPSATVATDANGVASVNATANGTAGAYTVTATTNGVSAGAMFNLTNSAEATPVVTMTSGNNQDANPLASFSCLLQLKITDQALNPLANVSINFVAPAMTASTPTATLSNGTTSGTTVMVMTDSNGMAGVTATANGVSGSYDISAQMASDGSVLASYLLTNLGTNDRIFANGFDNTPAVCPN